MDFCYHAYIAKQMIFIQYNSVMLFQSIVISYQLCWLLKKLQQLPDNI